MFCGAVRPTTGTAAFLNSVVNSAVRPTVSFPLTWRRSTFTFDDMGGEATFHLDRSGFTVAFFRFSARTCFVQPGSCIAVFPVFMHFDFEYFMFCTVVYVRLMFESKLMLTDYSFCSYLAKSRQRHVQSFRFPLRQYWDPKLFCVPFTRTDMC